MNLKLEDIVGKKIYPVYSYKQSNYLRVEGTVMDVFYLEKGKIEGIFYKETFDINESSFYNTVLFLKDYNIEGYEQIEGNFSKILFSEEEAEAYLKERKKLYLESNINKL